MPFEYTPPTTTLETAGGAITLRGLNVDDLGYLVNEYGDAVNTILDGDINPSLILSKAPAMVADIIACAADDRRAADKAALLPMGLQICALTEIFRLSFTVDNLDSLGNAMRLFVEMFHALTKQPKNPPNPAI